MQGLNGVPSKPSMCGVIALALPGLLWLLWGIRVTVVIGAYIEGLAPCMYFWILAISPRAVSYSKGTIWRGTYRRLSPPP